MGPRAGPGAVSDTIAVTFYKGRRHMDRVLEIVRGSSPDVRVVVVTSRRNARALEEAADATLRPGWDALVPGSDEELLRMLLDMLDGDGEGMSVDLTHADPREVAAVCKLSAMADIGMYDGDGPVSSFPRVLPLTGAEVVVLEAMGRREFTRAELVAATGMDRSAAYRVLKDLVDKGCLIQGNSRPGRTGRPDVVYRAVEEGLMMARICRRAVDRLPSPAAATDSADMGDSGERYLRRSSAWAIRTFSRCPSRTSTIMSQRMLRPLPHPIPDAMAASLPTPPLPSTMPDRVVAIWPPVAATRGCHLWLLRTLI